MMRMHEKFYIIATHELVYGAPQALSDYLSQIGGIDFLYIAHSLGSDSQKSYVKRNTTQFYLDETLRFKFGFLIFKYFGEIILNLKWVFKFSKSDLPIIFIGVNPLNAFSGLILRLAGKVDFVIYYTIDFTPIRFRNRVLNILYHSLDRICASRADETWNVSPRIDIGRVKKSPNLTFRPNSHFVVPIGIWKIASKIQLKRKTGLELIFLGTILEKQGVQKVLEAFKLINKKYEKLHLTIVGDGEYLETIKEYATKLGIVKSTTFTGLITDPLEVRDYLIRADIGFATYDPSMISFTEYADPTKHKDYLSAGVPVIMTNVTHNCSEIENAGCGLIVDYDTEDISKALATYLEDLKYLRLSQTLALKYAAQFKWSKIFQHNLSRIDEKMNTEE